MNKSKLTALSAMATALTVIVLTVGAYLLMFELSVLLLGSLFVMLPLSKKSYFGSFLTVLASSVLTLFLSGFRFQIILPYALFFGLHPIVNFFEKEKKLNKWVMLVIKDIWFVLTLLMMQWLLEVLAVDIDFLKEFLYPILIIGGGIFFVIYDYLISRFQAQINMILTRLKL